MFGTLFTLAQGVLDCGDDEVMFYLRHRLARIRAPHPVHVEGLMMVDEAVVCLGENDRAEVKRQQIDAREEASARCQFAEEYAARQKELRKDKDEPKNRKDGQDVRLHWPPEDACHDLIGPGFIAPLSAARRRLLGSAKHWRFERADAPLTATTAGASRSTGRRGQPSRSLQRCGNNTWKFTACRSPSVRCRGCSRRQQVARLPARGLKPRVSSTWPVGESFYVACRGEKRGSFRGAT